MITIQFKQLNYQDYAKLMQLLPRLRLQLERAGDDEGANGVMIATNRVGKKAIEYIREAEKGTDEKPSAWAESIVNKQ